MAHRTTLGKVLLISFLTLLGMGQVSTVSAGANIWTQTTSVKPEQNSASVQAAAGVWETVSSPTTNSLWSLDFSSPTSGWAGGPNVLLRYDGISWQNYSVPALGTNYYIGSISMLSDTDGWLVGRAVKSNPYPETIVFHWDGSQWNEVTAPTAFALLTVSAVDDSHVYTAGGGTFCNPDCNDLMSWAYLWNGNSWSSTPVGSHRRVVNVSMAGNGDGWMVGDEVDTGTGQSASLAMRWVNDSWQSVSVPNVFNSRLYAVSTPDSNQAWAVGLFDTLMWNGSVWSVVSNQSIHGLRDVLAMAPNDAWAVGEMGTILHWDGSMFATSSNTATVDLNKVANSSPRDVWAVGMNGTILHYEEPSLKISGNVGVEGASLSYVDGGTKMVTSFADGSYSIDIPYGWSGVVTPHKFGYFFSPVNRSYAGVFADQNDQDYTPTIAPYHIYLALVMR